MCKLLNIYYKTLGTFHVHESEASVTENYDKASCKLRSCGLWWHVVLQYDTSVLENPAPSIFEDW